MHEPWKPDVNEADQRVVKTREGIRAAFERLIATTPYGDITVSAIAREARISRRTFYVHYGTVDELLRQMARERMERAAHAVQLQGELLDVADYIREFSHAVLVMLCEDPNLADNVIKSLSMAQLLDLAREPLKDIFREELSKRGIREADELDNCMTFCFGGLFAVYDEWERLGRDSEAFDDMASFVGEVAAHGVVGFF